MGECMCVHVIVVVGLDASTGHVIAKWERGDEGDN